MAKKQNDDLFFGLRGTMTDEQLEYERSIMDENNILTICNAKAGTGKTTIAVACSKILVSSGRYDGLTYIFAPVAEKVLGYTTGDAFEKEQKYHIPLLDALTEIREDIKKAVVGYNQPQKESESTSTKGTSLKKRSSTQNQAWVIACSHTFLRGSNLKNRIVIIDEAQNFTKQELRKVLTRCHDNCKVIMIGSTAQSDIKNSGFGDYIYYSNQFDRANICHLTKSFRGELAEWADNID